MQVKSSRRTAETARSAGGASGIGGGAHQPSNRSPWDAPCMDCTRTVASWTGRPWPDPTPAEKIMWLAVPPRQDPDGKGETQALSAQSAGKRRQRTLNRGITKPPGADFESGGTARRFTVIHFQRYSWRHRPYRRDCASPA